MTKPFKRNKIYLTDPIDDDVDLIRKKIKFILCLHETEYKVYLKNCKKLIDYLGKFINRPEYFSQTLMEDIQFYPNRIDELEGNIYTMKPIEFTYMYIMAGLYIRKNIIITGDELYCPEVPKTNTYNDYINRFEDKYKDHYTVAEYCETVADITNLYTRMFRIVGGRMGISHSIYDFIRLMKDDPKIREIISCSNIPENITPNELEKLSWDRIHYLNDAFAKSKHIPSHLMSSLNLVNLGQFKEYASHITFKSDDQGSTIPITDNTNILMGLNSADSQFVDGMGGRKAEILKLLVSVAGELEYDAGIAMSNLHTCDLTYSCDSQHYIPKKITSMKRLLNNLGRYYILDKDDKDIKIITKDSLELIGKTIYLTTPITCKHPRRHEGYICRRCYSEMLSVVNQHLHIGLISALDITHAYQQKLLQGKHRNISNTHPVVYNDAFYSYFVNYDNMIYIDPILFQTSNDSIEINSESFLEINTTMISKNKESDGNSFDRSIPEIIIVNRTNNQRSVITNTGGSDFFFSKKFNKLLIDNYSIKKKSTDKIFISLENLCHEGFCTPDKPLFEIQYINEELDKILNTLKRLISSKLIEKYRYEDLVEILVDLYDKGGMNVIDIQIELLIAELIHSVDKEYIDWNETEPEYIIKSIKSSIKMGNSALTTISHSSANSHLESNSLYNKTKPGFYDSLVKKI